MNFSILGQAPTLEELAAMVGPAPSNSLTPSWERALVSLGQSLGGHINNTPFMQVADSGDWAGAGKTAADILMRDVLGRDPETGEQGLPGVGLAGMTALRNAAQTLPGQISTRYPIAQKATEDPLTHDLVVGLGSSMVDPAAFAKNIELMRPYTPRSRARRPDRRAEDLIEFERDNLNRLFDEVPQDVREQTRKWYEGAHRLTLGASDKYGISPESAAGVYSALSPQKDWYMNVSLGDRVMDAVHRQGTVGWTGEMDAKLSSLMPRIKSSAGREAIGKIRGKDLSELSDQQQRALWIRIYDEAHNNRSYPAISPTGERLQTVLTANGSPATSAWGGTGSIASAVSSLDIPTLENISRQMGQQHKVRNFYNNIIAPESLRGDVTIDTHAVAANLLSPYAGSDAPVLHNFGNNVVGAGGPANNTLTGNKGTYGIHAEPYRRAAEDQGVLPREMQSITWEAIRGLFDNKTPAIKAAVNEIWDSHSRGLITQAQAQDAVLSAAGGINLPTWMQ